MKGFRAYSLRANDSSSPRGRWLSRALGRPGTAWLLLGIGLIATLLASLGTWTLPFRPGPAFARTPWFSAPGHVLAATLGLSISLLVFGIARSMAGTRRRAQALADEMTAKLRLQEYAMASAEQRYQDLINNLPVGVYRNTPGAKGHFIEVNPAIVAMFEAASKEELMGHNVSDLYVDPVRRKELSDKLTRQGFIKDEEVEQKTLRGRRFWASVTATMKTDAEGSVCFEGVIQDVTDRKRVYQELTRSQEDLEETVRQLKASNEELQRTQRQLIQAAKMESIGTLAAGVAHEVKNPLQTILMGLDYLDDRSQQPARNVELVLSDMREAVLRADTIARELLQLSRDTDFELIEGDLNRVVEHCLRLLNSELVGNRTGVVCRLESGLPRARMDVRKMEQVLLNLFINALQAMKQGGTLLVTTRSGRLGNDLHLNGSFAGQFHPGERLVVAEVQDDGPGIAPEHLTRIFDPFFTTKPVGVGTGLGLSIVRKIIDLHQGAIEVRNVPEGGAVVTLALRA
jgi:PAS domain S-box-containing protein